VRLYKAFRDLDENESGKIETEVLKKKICELNPYGNVDVILQIIDDVDLDNDGTIDYEEFLRALHPDFNETPNWFWSEENKPDSEPEPDSDDGGDSKENDDDDDINYNIDHDGISQETLDQAAKIKKLAIINNKTKPKKKIDPNAIIKQGYMLKEGKMIKSWRKRWFVLQNSGKMSYYHNEHEDEDKPIAQFNCKNLTKLLNKSWSKSNKKRYGVKVYTPHRNWKFLLQNNDERLEWIKAFETVSGKKAGNKASK